MDEIADQDDTRQPWGSTARPTDPEVGLVDLVMAAAETDSSLSEECRLLLLSVLTGDEELEADLIGGTRASARPAVSGADSSPAAGAYLKSIKVAGFRGIGPEAALDLHPAPGLVVVAGRNGSGKSTFSEAVEVALTRTSYRWRNKNAPWRAGWRNLHVSDPCRIRVELAEESIGITTVGVDWATDDELDDGTFWVQRAGQRRDLSDDPLGWAGPLELYRPLLSYDELGGILEAQPSQLYDKLSTVLGLTAITDAQDRLDAQVKETGAPRREATRLVEQAHTDLAGSADSRAREALELLRSRRPDLGALERLATGVSEPPSGDLVTLRTLASIAIPSLDEVRAAVAEWEAAQHSLAQSAGEETDALVRRISLLTHAVKHVQAAGPGACPVCGVGELDEAWAEHARREVDELNDQTATLRDARDRNRAAVQRLRTILPPMPSALIAELREDVAGRVETANAWQAVAEIDVLAADGPPRLRDEYSALVNQIAELRKAADAERQRREDLWAPLARKLAEVVGALRRADAADERGAIARTTATWLKTHANQLRNERLQPIADEAREVWLLLRQESNVDLGAIELEGSKTRRRATVSATVDGHEAGALTVMSQGELHALALALFLPRATMPASPFRFVMVDDPVQAMDPAKVDGLARVLDRIGKTHQVIVFTHDDRLPEAVRRLGVDARILEVERAEGSRVEIVNASDPAQRYLSDADAVAKDPGADDDVRRRVIPVLCRLAVESACRDLFMARRFARGDARAEIEAAWEAATGSREKLAIALNDDRRADIRGWLANGRRRQAAMGVIGSGSHDGLTRDPIGAVRDVSVMVEALRTGRR
jgi:recombinational DNA repair ATPase RecF